MIDAAAKIGDGESLEPRLRERLAALTGMAPADPMSNPIQIAAIELSRMVDRGEVTIDAIDGLVQHLAVRSFADRADRLRHYLADTDIAANEAALIALLRSIAATHESFESFQAAVEQVRFGIVLTAHPTFGMTVELARALLRVVTGRDADGQPLAPAEVTATLGEIATADHLPPSALTLDLEHRWSIEALMHIQEATDRLAGCVLDVAAERYPERWTELQPRLITTASWVGYDLDGRSDIAWTDTLAKRLTVKAAQLRRHSATLACLIGAEPGTPVSEALGLVDAAIVEVDRQLAAIAAVGQDPAALPQLVEVFRGGRSRALTDTGALRQLVTRAIEDTDDGARRRDLAVLRSSLRCHGLALARTHVRLNGSQLHNAIRKIVGMETAPNDPSHRRSYMNAINDLLSRAAPVTVNFATLMAERASAKRLFMIVQQMARYIDAELPVRFLIAETEAGFTLLTALYYARLFGVEDKVEISPLFETAEALERGDAIVDEALRSPHYHAYVRKLGRLCVQFGFSDSGRYLGQMAATFQIERLRLRLAAVMERHGLTDIELVLFNTHGESIGRGGHPGSLADRIRYVSPPMTRGVFERAGIKVVEEVSFQGGDGFLHFMGTAPAFAVVRGALSAVLRADPEAQGDPIYAENDFAVQFFATIKQVFATLVDDPTYATLLGAFGTNLLPATGSRPVKRQHEGGLKVMDVTHVAQLRAIPNNAILQQVGLFANTLSGVGRARSNDPELFEHMRLRSPRFRRAIAMCEAALGASDTSVLKAYIDLFDPGVWLTRAGRTARGARAQELSLVSQALEQLDLHPPLAKLYRRLQADFLDLVDRPGVTRGGLTGSLAAEQRQTLLLLHVTRLMLIQRIYLLAVHIPEFSPQHGVSRGDLVARLLRLDVPGAVGLLREIFPRVDASAIPGDAGEEPSTYQSNAGQSYAREHETLFEPMLRLHTLILRIGTAIAYQIGAVG
ncbi:MAG TPA: phosphoenolpyruvate carboxylase [Stellaceae bacterium]|nr:phosphoenolpyruvate carboxylase [Stellaceae bacterium]